MDRGVDQSVVPPIFADESFVLQPSSECAIPGYLVLRLKSGEESLSELGPEKARALGGMLARAARAIEDAVGAERVYVLSFCEVDRRLHFHLFPRSEWLLREYMRANPKAWNQAVNGPALFAWARQAFVAGNGLSAGIPGGTEVSAAIRAILEQGG